MPQTTIKNSHAYDSRELQFTLRYNFNSARSKYKGKGAGSEAKGRL